MSEHLNGGRISGKRKQKRALGAVQRSGNEHRGYQLFEVKAIQQKDCIFNFHSNVWIKMKIW